MKIKKKKGQQIAEFEYGALTIKCKLNRKSFRDFSKMSYVPKKMLQKSIIKSSNQ